MRIRGALVILALLALVAVPAPAEDDEGPKDDYTPAWFETPSPEPGGHACYPYLRSPLRRPADTVCGACENGEDCSQRARPKGERAPCWGSDDKECFWKRHARAWGLVCSQCWAEEECEVCDPSIGGRSPEILETLNRQLAIERSFGNRPLWIAVSKHFYVVTDIHRKLKLPTEGGAPRLATGHEVAHLYAQRCELAYDDFVHYFGGSVSLGKPMAVYLFARTADKQAAAKVYLGGATTDMLYGGGGDRIAGGFSGNGFVTSLQEERSDLNLHANCRHMIGHILFSCWLRVSPHEKECPKWAFIGAAHFLEKLLPEHRDYATFCSNETAAPTGSPKDWDRKARALAGKRIDPIETFFGRESMGSFSYSDHIRAWSIMDLMLREDNARWLKVLREIRYGAPEGAAFKEGLGITPHAFNERWLERLRGRRPTMGELRRDAHEEDEPGAAERRRIVETDAEDVLAGLVRGLDVIDDLRTLKVVISRMDHPSDLVRETIHLVLGRTREPKLLAWLETGALADDEEMVRAGVARVLGEMKRGEAREALEALLADRHWLVRAEAAWALGRIGDLESLPILVRALENERTDKTWILISDAVAAYGRPSREATLALIPKLSHRHWQVRVTACQGLARVGTEEALDPLIARFNREGGRLYRELRAALKAVSQDDLGPNPETWRKWWESQKEEHGGLGPMPEIRNPTDDRYGDLGPPGEDDPTYYGHRIFSKSVGFVLDTSGSMNKTIRIPPEAAERLGGLVSESTRFDLAKDVLIGTMQKLDPRVRFSLVFFSTQVRPWKRTLMPATPGNLGSAASAIRAQPSSGETNIHGALKAAIGLHEKPSLEARLDPIPDTVYFLTDGSPTRGQIIEADALLSWFENLNRYAKVELHVIAMGNLGVDLPFLERLAKVGGGTFTHVPER